MRQELGRTPSNIDGRRLDERHPSYYQQWEVQSEADEPSPRMFAEYVRNVRRHWKLIVCLGCLGCFCAVLLHLRTQPVYRTRMSLNIETLNRDFLTMQSISPTIQASPGETDVQTQIKLLQSDSLMERVRDRLTLEPHPQSVEQNDLLSRAGRTLHLGSAHAIPFDSLLTETAKGVTVKPLGITRLVEITCDSWDAAFAAKFCNTLTSEFQAEDLESRGSEAKHTSDWLMHQATDIRQKEEESQQKLFAATGGNGLILSQQTETVGEDRLRRIQAELVKAQADRMEKQAQAEVARTASPDSTPNVVDSPAYAASRMKLADLETQVAALVPPLTEQNPRVIRLRSQISQLQNSMVTQRTDSSHRLQNEYAAAKHREDLLTIAYRAEEGNVSGDLEKGSQVSLLRREVESEQQLYQTLLQRSKEAGFASAMQAATVRVVDNARRPKFDVYPQRLTACAIGTILGSLLGLCFAFFRERNVSVLREPGESLRLLQISELGVIPSPPTSNWLNSSLRTESTAGLVQLPAATEHPMIGSVRWDDAYSLVAEAYRNATLSIMLSDKGARSRVYVVSSPSAGEGKTTITSNLGIALSKSKLRVLLIDGDLRRPNLHSTLGIPNVSGLRDILRSDSRVSPDALLQLCQPTAFPKLFILAAGSGIEDPVELLHSPELGNAIEHLREEFDVVLIDSPPVLHMADARLLSSHAEGTILILRSGLTHREEAMSARDLLDRDQVRVIGTVLNDFDPGKQGRSNYYSSYYAYQHGSVAKADVVART